MSTTDNAEPAAPATEPDVGDDGQPRGGSTDDSHHDDDDDGGDVAKARRQAAGYRTKLREAEAERDALAGRVSAAEATIIGHAIAAAGIDPRLWELSDVDVDALRNENGILDIAATMERAQQIRTEVYGAGPRPNPQQGVPSATRGGRGLAEAFDPRHRQG